VGTCSEGGREGGREGGWGGRWIYLGHDDVMMMMMRATDSRDAFALPWTCGCVCGWRPVCVVGRVSLVGASSHKQLALLPGPSRRIAFALPLPFSPSAGPPVAGSSASASLPLAFVHMERPKAIGYAISN